MCLAGSVVQLVKNPKPNPTMKTTHKKSSSHRQPTAATSSKKSPTSPAHPTAIPSPLGGERARVRGDLGQDATQSPTASKSKSHPKLRSLSSLNEEKVPSRGSARGEESKSAHTQDL